MTPSGQHVVITRPTGQAEHLATLLVEQGMHPIFFPVLTIHDCADITPVLEAAIALDTYDLAVFVSPNAIEKALDIILPRRAWPAHVPALALGKMSEQALVRRGVTHVISPPLRFDSEALLELPELMAVTGKRIIIFRGETGRELLGETLMARGAEVHHVACYRRLASKADPGPLLKRWEAGTLEDRKSVV